MGSHEGENIHGHIGKYPKKLIEAVVDCVYEGSPPPVELRINWQCQRYHCLPDTGAYFDQDYILMSRMASLSNIYNVLQRWQGLDGKQIHSLTDNERKTLKSLKDMGVIFN